MAIIHRSLNWQTHCSAVGLVDPTAWLGVAGGSLPISRRFGDILMVAFLELLWIRVTIGSAEDQSS